MAINFDNLLLEEDSVLALMTGADKESGAARFEPRSSRDRRRQRKERLMRRNDSGLFHFLRKSWHRLGPHFRPYFRLTLGLTLGLTSGLTLGLTL